MTYAEAIKSGFRLINSKWQLVAVQVGMMIINCIGFFIVVGIPLGIAFIIFGLDLTGLTELRDILGVFQNPAELLSKYFWLLLILISSILFYVLLASTLGLFVFGGSFGVLGRSFIEPVSKFRMHSFFSEAKKIFFPLMWFSLFVGLVFIGIAFILGLFGGGAAVMVSFAKSQDSTLALFLGIFFSLILILIALSIILTALAVTVYGFAILFFKGEGAVKSFKGSAEFLWNNQQAFWLYVILFIGYVFASFIMMLIVYPFNLIPFIGTILSFPVQILSYVVQSYLGLAMIAVIFNYYFDAEIRKTEKIPETPDYTTGGSSTTAEDISVSQSPEHEETPSQKDEQELT